MVQRGKKLNYGHKNFNDEEKAHGGNINIKLNRIKGMERVIL